MLYHKFLLVLLFSCAFLYADQRMNALQHQSIHPYNKKPSLQQKGRCMLDRLSNVDPEAAARIAARVCGYRPQLRLRHIGTLLFYRSLDPHCTITINALDGSITKENK